MNEVIIYGGAFNPPTTAHQIILQACLNRAEQSGGQVWLTLSGNRADKVIGTNRNQRVKLAKALCESVIVPTSTKLRIETIELDQRSATETYKTHTELTKQHPENDFKWVFGADSIATMSTWKSGDWLKSNLGMLIIPRAEVVLEDLPVHGEILDVTVPMLSSTEVRAKIQAGDPYKDMVPESVYRVLEYT